MTKKEIYLLNQLLFIHLHLTLIYTVELHLCNSTMVILLILQNKVLKKKIFFCLFFAVIRNLFCVFFSTLFCFIFQNHQNDLKKQFSHNHENKTLSHTHTHIQKLNVRSAVIEFYPTI